MHDREPPRALGALAALRASSAHRRTGVRWLACAWLVLSVALATPFAAGCDDEAAGDASAEITVFAAASLTDAFTELGEKFTAAHPDVTVAFSFAGSQDLVAQLEQGAPADVLATADTQTMELVGGLTSAPETFAGNKLAIAVAPGNPEGIESLDDLARDELKVVLAAPEVPAGKYAEQILERADVTVTPVSLEVNVKGVVTKVALGEADAGIVYVTDVAAAAGEIDGIGIPDADNVLATYPIAVVTASDEAAAAQSFVDLVLSSEGQQVLRRYGFLTREGG